MMIKNNRLPAEIIMQKPIEQIPNTPLNNEKTDELLKLKIYLLAMITLMILTIFRLYLLIIEKILK